MQDDADLYYQGVSTLNQRVFEITLQIKSTSLRSSIIR